MRLRRQLAGGSQVLNNLTQVGIDALVDLVAQVQMHAEHVVGAERLDRIGKGVRFVHGLDIHKPPGAGALGMLVQDRIDDIAVDVVGMGVLGQVHDVVAHALVTVVVAQALELRQVAAQRQQRKLALLDRRAVVPAHHNAHDECSHKDGEIAAVEELGERAHEEEAFEQKEEGREDPRSNLELALLVQVEEEQQRGAHHSQRNGKAVGGFHMRRVLEQQHHDDAADKHDVVDHGDVELALGLGRVEDLHVRHEVQTAGLGHQRECAGDERLRGNDGRDGGKADGKRAQARGEHLVERVEVGNAHELGVGSVVDKPRALAHIGKQQTALNERPGGVDVAAADVAHVGVERLGTGGGEEAAAQNHDARVVVGAQQKGDAAHRVEAQQHGGVLEDKEQTRAAQEQEPQRHDGAKGVTDLGRTDALYQEERDDDGERNGDDAALVIAQHGMDRRDGAQALDGRGNGNGRRQDAVGEQRGATQHGGDDKPLATALDQAVQGKDAALTMVIGAQRDEHILDGGQQRDRPHDKGERAKHELLRHASDAAVAGNERLGYIHRAGADIAVHHAQRDEHRRDAHRNRSVRGCLLGLLFHKPVSSQL